jgi:hypothetical protein
MEDKLSAAARPRDKDNLFKVITVGSGHPISQAKGSGKNA